MIGIELTIVNAETRQIERFSLRRAAQDCTIEVATALILGEMKRQGASGIPVTSAALTVTRLRNAGGRIVPEGKPIASTRLAKRLTVLA